MKTDSDRLLLPLEPFSIAKFLVPHSRLVLQTSLERTKSFSRCIYSHCYRQWIFIDLLSGDSALLLHRFPSRNMCRKALYTLQECDIRRWRVFCSAWTTELLTEVVGDFSTSTTVSENKTWERAKPHWLPMKTCHIRWRGIVAHRSEVFTRSKSQYP